MLRTSKGIGKPSRPRVYDICETSKYAASSLPGMYIRSPRWPLLGSAPGTVVNGQRFRLAGGGTYGTEYKGVGGVWVAQPSVTMQLWKSRGVFKNEGLDVVDCGKPPFYATLDARSNNYIVKAKVSIASYASAGLVYSISNSATDTRLSLYAEVNGIFQSDVAGLFSTNTKYPIITGFMQEVVVKCIQSQQIIEIDGVTIYSGAIGVNDSTANLMIGGRSSTAVNLEGSIASVSFYRADSSGNITEKLDEYNFDKWDGTGSGVSENGNPFTVTDGTPFTAKSFAWLPL